MLSLSLLLVKILASTRYKVAKFTSHGFGAAPGEQVNLSKTNTSWYHMINRQWRFWKMLNVDLRCGGWGLYTLSFSDTAFKKSVFQLKKKTRNGQRGWMDCSWPNRLSRAHTASFSLILTQNSSSLTHFKVGLIFRVIGHCFSGVYSCEWGLIICSRLAIRRLDEFLTCHKIWIGRLRLSHSRNTAMSRFGIRTLITRLIRLMTLKSFGAIPLKLPG